MADTAENVIKSVFDTMAFVPQVMFQPDIKRVLNSKKVTDHHAIIPTMEITKADLGAVPDGEKQILFLVANRLLCATGEKHSYETVKAELSCNGVVFKAHGKSVVNNGWKIFEDSFKAFYKGKVEKEDTDEDVKLPELYEDMVRNMVQKYHAYLIPEGIEDFTYTKDGKEIKGTQYKFKMEFPKRK